MSHYETVFGMQSDRERIAGEILEEELANRKMTRVQLANDLAISRANITKAMRGDMSLVTQRAIEMDAFNWPIGFLRDVLRGDIEAIERYEVTPDFRDSIKQYAINELRRVAMVLPVDDDNGERRENGR